MKMYDLANCIALHLARETGLERSRVDRVRFGLELLLGELIKFAILLSAAALLGWLPETLAAMAGFSLFRLVSGGPHCEDYWRCLVFSFLVYLGPAATGVYAVPYVTGRVSVMAVLAGVVVMAALVVVWAPGEVYRRKIKPGERGLFKRLSLLFLTLWAAALIVFIAPHSISAVTAGLLGSAAQAFTFTPPGYRAVDSFDVFLSKIIGERRCPAHAENA
ncbi:MAG: accessory gene regulator B family protein [Firmicutes bacterium]|nr:accessory gene regulator B family protein [Bacillota bacterium]MCL5058317.1 accessory gene regulator B family protein [Actinomycetota bacterium]